MDLKSKIILIAGPTACGKSNFALKLCKKGPSQGRRQKKLTNGRVFSDDARARALQHQRLTFFFDLASPL